MRLRRGVRGLPGLAVTVGLACLAVTGTAQEALAARAGSPSGGAPHEGATPAAEATLTPATGAGVTVAMAPVGLSIEYPVMAADLGTGECPPPALVAQLQRLGSPPLELAGVSQDLTAPSGAVSGSPESWEEATLYSLPSPFWSQLHCLLSTTKDPLTVGLDLRVGQLSWAAQMIASAQAAATNGLAFSLGNEPDLYQLPNYFSLDKPQPGEETLAVNRYLEVAGQYQPLLGGAPVTGPELARPAAWQHELPRVISQLHEQVLGVHMYPLSACQTPRAVTISGLLTASVGQAPRRLSWVVSDARAAGIPAIISEANSASCGGKTGVSDSPAAAVWAVRFVLSALDTGFQEVRFHFSGDPYDPFLVRGTEILPRPLLSALEALNRWLPVGSSVHPLTNVRGLVVSKLQSTSGTTVLLLDNESGQARRVVLRGAHSASVETLSASSPGLTTTSVSSPHKPVELTVAANSVVAASAPIAVTPAAPTPTP